MTEASPAMVVATLLIVAMNVWLLRRRALPPHADAHRDQVIAMTGLVLSALGGPFVMLALLKSLTHGSELSNLGDGLLSIALAALHLVGWPIVALATARRR